MARPQPGPVDPEQVQDPQTKAAITEADKRHRENEDRNIASPIRSRLEDHEARLKALEAEVGIERE